MVQDAIAALIAHGEDEGFVCMSELERLSQELELDDEQLSRRSTRRSKSAVSR